MLVRIIKALGEADGYVRVRRRGGHCGGCTLLLVHVDGVVCMVYAFAFCSLEVDLVDD